MDNGPGSATVIASLALLGLHMSVDRIGDGRIGAACLVLVDDRGTLAVVAHPGHQGGPAARRRGPAMAPGLRSWGGPSRRAPALTPQLTADQTSSPAHKRYYPEPSF